MLKNSSKIFNKRGRSMDKVPILVMDVKEGRKEGRERRKERERNLPFPRCEEGGC